MNKIIMEMQKVQNVGRTILFILLLGVSNSIFPQKILEGRFNNNSHFYNFYSNGIFEYKEARELGVGEYGNGGYILTKDSLIIDYNLTNIEIQGYHISKPYTNFKDTIRIDIKVYDFDKNELEGAEILFFTEKKYLTQKKTNEKGKVYFNFQKKTAKKYCTSYL